MEGRNRALKNQSLSKAFSILESISEDEIPCIFISYQRTDEEYASGIADHIMSKKIDVYFDLKDTDLKLENQKTNPKGVTNAIKKGLNQSQYMIVIVSPTTYRSPWVPFEVGYAFDKIGDDMKILRHKEIDKDVIPAYLKVKELLQGTASLNKFIAAILSRHQVYERLLQKGERLKTFSMYDPNPLSKYLDNE
jgi:hypothetical protein